LTPWETVPVPYGQGGRLWQTEKYIPPTADRTLIPVNLAPMSTGSHSKASSTKTSRGIMNSLKTTIKIHGTRSRVTCLTGYWRSTAYCTDTTGALNKDGIVILRQTSTRIIRSRPFWGEKSPS
jgi:hypothetical protein